MSLRSRFLYPWLCLARCVLIAFVLSAWCASAFAEDLRASIHYEPGSRNLPHQCGRQFLHLWRERER